MCAELRPNKLYRNPHHAGIDGTRGEHAPESYLQILFSRFTYRSRSKRCLSGANVVLG